MLSGGMMSGSLGEDEPIHQPSNTQHLRTYVLGRLDRIEPMLTFPQPRKR